MRVVWRENRPFCRLDTDGLALGIPPPLPSQCSQGYATERPNECKLNTINRTAARHRRTQHQASLGTRQEFDMPPASGSDRENHPE